MKILFAFVALALVLEAAPGENKVVYREAGRLGGWPANHGIWQWGDEILVGFAAAWHKERTGDRHQQDPDKPEEPRLARSLDGGATWTVEAPRDLLPPAQGGREPRDLAQPMDFSEPGFAMTIRFIDSNAGPSLLWYTYDKGKSWSGPFRFPQFGNGVLARTDYEIEGPRAATVYLTEAKANKKEGRPFCARTKDGGRTWKFVSYLDSEPNGFAIMPSTVRLSPAKLLSVVRVHEGTANRIDSYGSGDNGAHWAFAGTVAGTGEFGGNPGMLLKLRDGRLCVTYGYRAKPYGIRARLSRDEGKTWGEVIPVREGAAAWDMGYPRSVQRSDGKVVTVYYFNDAPHNERFVAATIWDPGAAAAKKASGVLDLSNAVIVSDAGDLPKAERTAALVLAEEVEKRTGLRLRSASQLPVGQAAIAIGVGDVGGIGAEGYRIRVEQGPSPRVTIHGKDARGVLFGVGHLLRLLNAEPKSLTLAADTAVATSPRYRIRGHQLGYRAQANSYDAWSAAQFEQYIRELTFFGVNSIESIPFHDDRETPVMKFPRRDINRAMGEICDRYGLDYWAWIPADFELKDAKRRSDELKKCDQFFRDTPQLTGVFFPGGDPGNNAPELVLPYLEDMARSMRASHAQAKIWLSLQWFTKEQVDWIYRYIDQRRPPWFGGLVAGPSSPPIPETRARLPKQYGLRSYPDLTHNKLSQYEVPSWDQAYALTLGREAINPRPAEYALIHNREAAYTDGFISYSDGIHDDVNKTVWSALSWDPDQNVRDILVQYSRAYFQANVDQAAADAILGLERNWRGPLIDNGAVEGTLLQWQSLEARAPRLERNWRWQMCLLRANYDAYIRHRLMSETKLEDDANRILSDAGRRGSERAMIDAERELERSVSEPPSPRLRDRIVDLCDLLFRSIGLQTSVNKYFAIGEERGAVLDFVDRPLNNRWWLEDRFAAVRGLGSEDEKVKQLVQIAKWGHPGEGSFYDDIGNVANEPHVVAFEHATEPDTGPHPGAAFWWWDNGLSRARLSWQTTAWPSGMVYEALDPNATYVVRETGYGSPMLRINGERVEAAGGSKEIGDVREFPVDRRFLKGRRLTLTWERPPGEEKLNWRNRSRLAEVWLIREH
ncbi:MAG: hypothetical protein JWO80_2645 [Bryobacterales bacterium]|nr:hypothetical protein [Bryobacterales bacterium]